MVYQTQFGWLKYPLAGCFQLCGTPIIPLDTRLDDLTQSEAIERVSYHG